LHPPPLFWGERLCGFWPETRAD